jgi:hypothetical protein
MMRRVIGLLPLAAVALTAGATLSAIVGGAGGSAAGLSLSSAALTPYRTCVLTATPSSTSVVSDAEVRQANPGTSYGTQTTMAVSSAASSNRRVYVWFDLTACAAAIPATASVRAATLRLYASALPPACRTLDIFRATASWTETGLTWTNQPFGTAINNPASGSRSTSFDIGTPTGCANRTAGYVAGVDVTSDVAAFVSGSATNRGWMLRDDAEGSATARTVTFSAKQLGTIGQAPQLVVTWVPAS